MTIIRQKLAKLEKGEGAVEKAWRGALTRAARDTVGIDLVVTDLESAREVPVLSGLVPENALIFALQRHEGDWGIAILSPTVSSALVEMQMTGRISANAPCRPPTQIDATLCQDMIDVALAVLDQMTEDAADWTRGFRVIRPLPTADAAAHILPDSTMRRLSTSVALDGGSCTGVLTVLLPRSQPVLLAAGSAESAFQTALTRQIMTAEATLNAVLCNLTVPLSAVMALAPGQTIPLPQATIGQVRVETTCGKTVAQGNLGQNRGMRAIRLGGEETTATTLLSQAV